MEAKKLVVRFELPSTDPAQIGIHFAADPVDQEGDVEVAFDALFDAIKTWYPATVKVDRYTWYGRAAGFPQGETDWGDAFRDIQRNAPGVASAAVLPLECAAVVTLGLPSVVRRNQGRVYFPPPGTNALASDGRFATGFTSALATAWDAFDAATFALGYEIRIRTTKGAPPPAYGLRPTEWRVDNNPDTIRKRGHKLWSDRQVRTAST